MFSSVRFSKTSKLLAYKGIFYCDVPKENMKVYLFTTPFKCFQDLKIEFRLAQTIFKDHAP